MARLNDEIIEELEQDGPRLEFISLEDGKHQRLKYVGLSFTKLPECRRRARVELERRAGQTTVASAEGSDSTAGKLRAAAQATLEAIARSVDARPNAFELVDIKPVMVFDEAAVIVAVTVRYDGKEKRIVGFSVIDEEHPFRAAPLAVLNATNRFLGARCWAARSLGRNQSCCMASTGEKRRAEARPGILGRTNPGKLSKDRWRFRLVP